jgi:DNA polymerase I-like protein with 3'-5' exonuclease and polymerase domains
MGKIYNLKQAQEFPSGQIKEWLYNALDVTGTREIADVLLPRLIPETEFTYKFERAQQNPAFSMMMRGVRIDVAKRDALVKKLKAELGVITRRIAKMPGVVDVWDGKVLETGWCPVNLGKHHKWPKGVPDSERKCEHCHTDRIKLKPFEPTSQAQVRRLFYELHKIPGQYNKKHEISVDDDVLDRIGKKFPKVQHITEAIREVRDRQKQIGSLSAKLTKDNRYPSSFNVGAAWTGRFSSSKNPFGQGGNLQNWSEQHRHVAIPDYGYDIAYIDLKQAESNVVAHLAGDEAYIEAHRIGDVHTYVTRLVWPDMPWTGDIKQDKKIAKRLPEWDNVEGHDFRFQAKRIQHGSNFGLTPPGISMIAHIPLKEAKFAQANYFKAFPGIKAWQDSIAASIRGHEPLTNVLFRTVQLMGRPWDPHTIKQGLSFKPQSSVADILDLAMIRIWLEMDPHELQLLAQVHDALLAQYPSGRLDLVRKAAQLMRIPIEVNNRIMVIEAEIAVGKNWGHKSEHNPEGLEEIEI